MRKPNILADEKVL